MLLFPKQKNIHSGVKESKGKSKKTKRLDVISGPLCAERTVMVQVMGAPSGYATPRIVFIHSPKKEQNQNIKQKKVVWKLPLRGCFALLLHHVQPSMKTANRRDHSARRTGMRRTLSGNGRVNPLQSCDQKPTIPKARMKALKNRPFSSTAED